MNKHTKQGISLLEVLAAIFVLSIGLLGVLAVIPFGAFQVSKAQHAEYASNMLANAAEIIIVKNMVSAGQDATGTGFVWVEPYEMPGGSDYIEFVFRDDWTEFMRGQDDLEYKMPDEGRPDFVVPRADAGEDGNEDSDKIRSTGKYTWFFTFKQPNDTDDHIAVDVLACFNRVQDSDIAVSAEFIPSVGGGTFLFDDRVRFANLADRLSQTNYVFAVSQPDASERPASVWCKIVFLDLSNVLQPVIVVTAADPENIPDAGGIQVYIPNGVLYHKGVRVM